jgi:hypothetical protein
MNQESAPPDAAEMCSAEEAYRCGSNIGTLRSGMQHKCVEMSLQITTGLAAAVVALMLSKSADLSTVNPPTKVCLVIVVDLYTFLQLLLLANYLFHTFIVTISWLGPHELSRRLDEAIGHKLLQKQKCPTPFEKTSAAILNCFQPLIIYFSGFIGFLACLGFALWLLPPIWSWPCWFFVIIAMVLLCVLIILGLFHINMEMRFVR